MKTKLTEDEKRVLLQMARAALEAAANHQKLAPVDLGTLPERLQAPGASFVTLTKLGTLRGCIGTLNAKAPLAEDVRQHAVDAALYDHRFFPVQPEEVQSIAIEVSVLSEPQAMPTSDPMMIPKLLRPGVDGVVILCGDRRATFLPQVWQKVSTPEEFLAMLCQKAGIPSDAWTRGDVEILIYQVESFHEKIPAA
jgi:AmmeMemoRadiSam system protein A